MNRFLIFTLVIPFLSGCGQSVWNDYHGGLDRLQQERRRGLVAFTTKLSADSREMEGVMADPEVQKLLKHFVIMRVDAVIDKSVVDQFGVQTIPAFVVLRPDLTVAGGAEGKMDVDRFRGFLIKHSFD